MKTIYWFRQDLRIQDNHGRSAALKNSSQILPIFIIDINLIQEFGGIDVRFGFIKDVLQNLQKELKKINLNIHIYKGDPKEIIEKLVNTYNIQQVYANKSYDSYGIKRDLGIRLPLKEKGVSFIMEDDYLVVQPQQLKPYQIFSPYAKAWEKVSSYESYDIPSYLGTLISSQQEKESDDNLQSLGHSHPSWTFTDPSKILKNFKVKEYESLRNMLGAGGTSKISPYLRFGVISPRQLYHFAHQANNQTLIKEIARREFRYQLAFHFPESLIQSFQSKRRGIQRENNAEHFQAFCEGKTGYPIIDAAIRQLLTENRMHGRARMIVASFLTKDLLIDRKRGEEFFKKYLLDYDQIVNIGNRQRSASVGADPRPLRIFSPILQAQRFDPDASYIKKYLPELKTISADQLHDPLRYHLNYHTPIVDHALAAKKTKFVYDQAKSEYYSDTN